MRIGITSANPIVKVLCWLGILPTPLLVGFWGMEVSRVLIAAVEMRIFDELARQPRTAEHLARDLGYDDVGTEVLLGALNGFGYLKRRDRVFSLRRQARRWLTSDARFSLVRPFGLFSLLWNELDDVEERVRTGGPGEAPVLRHRRRMFQQPQFDHAGSMQNTHQSYAQLAFDATGRVW